MENKEKTEKERKLKIMQGKEREVGHAAGEERIWKEVKAREGNGTKGRGSNGKEMEGSKGKKRTGQ